MKILYEGVEQRLREEYNGRKDKPPTLQIKERNTHESILPDIGNPMHEQEKPLILVCYKIQPITEDIIKLYKIKNHHFNIDANKVFCRRQNLRGFYD